MDPNQAQQPNIETKPADKPAPIAASTSQNAPQGGHHGLLFALLAIIAVVGGVALFLFVNQQQTPRLSEQPIPTVAIPSPTATPTDEQELESLDTGNPEQDLQNIQGDLNQL